MRAKPRSYPEPHSSGTGEDATRIAPWEGSNLGLLVDKRVEPAVFSQIGDGKSDQSGPEIIGCRLDLLRISWPSHPEAQASILRRSGAFARSRAACPLASLVRG